MPIKEFLARMDDLIKIVSHESKMNGPESDLIENIRSNDLFSDDGRYQSFGNSTTYRSRDSYQTEVVIAERHHIRVAEEELLTKEEAPSG